MLKEPSSARGQRTRTALLDATERCLGRGGYGAATTTGIAGEAGVSVGAFYTYFDDRDGALVALFDARLGDLVTAVTEALTTDALLDDGLDAVLGRALETVLREYRDHAPVFRAALAQLPSTPALREVYWRWHDASEEAIVAFLRRGQAAGKVRAGDPVVLARTLLVVVQGTNNPLLLSGDATPIVAEVRRLLTSLLLP